MPGRHGKQRIKKKKSKRLPVTEMEKTLKDSIHGRKRKEKAILKDLIPPTITTQTQKFAFTSSLPMFQPLFTSSQQQQQQKQLTKESSHVPKANKYK